MIVGIGIDVVDLAGFRDQLEQSGTNMLDRMFTEAERRDSTLRPAEDKTPHLAARYAAKEAFTKAWSGSRWGYAPHLSHIDLRDVEVVSDAYGRPQLRLHGDVAAAVGDVTIHVSLSHDGGVAAAYVTIERVS